MLHLLPYLLPLSFDRLGEDSCIHEAEINIPLPGALLRLPIQSLGRKILSMLPSKTVREVVLVSKRPKFTSLDETLPWLLSPGSLLPFRHCCQGKIPFHHVLI